MHMHLHRPHENTHEHTNLPTLRAYPVLESGFPQALICGEDIISCLKPAAYFAEPALPWGQGLGRAVVSDPGNSTLCHSIPIPTAPWRPVIISPKAAKCAVCDTFEIVYVPFGQHCLINFLLTLSHCLVAFCSLWLISSPPSSQSYMLYFMV